MRNSSHRLAKPPSVSAFTRSSVNVCQRSVTTKYSSPRRRQLKSSTSRAWPTRLAKLLEPGLVKFAVAKQPRGDDHVRRPGVDPPGGVVRRDAAADLQPARPGGECLAGSIVVALAKLDHVAAAQVVATVQLRIPSGRFFRDEVGAQGIRPRVVDGAPTICFTLPSCRSMHGLNTRRAYGRLAKRSSFGGGNLIKKARVAARFAVCSPAWMPTDRFATSP